MSERPDVEDFIRRYAPPNSDALHEPWIADLRALVAAPSPAPAGGGQADADADLWRTHALMCGAAGGAVMFRREFYRCAQALGLWPASPGPAAPDAREPSERVYCMDCDEELQPTGDGRWFSCPRHFNADVRIVPAAGAAPADGPTRYGVGPLTEPERQRMGDTARAAMHSGHHSTAVVGCLLRDALASEAYWRGYAADGLDHEDFLALRTAIERIGCRECGEEYCATCDSIYTRATNALDRLRALADEQQMLDHLHQRTGEVVQGVVSKSFPPPASPAVREAAEGLLSWVRGVYPVLLPEDQRMGDPWIVRSAAALASSDPAVREAAWLKRQADPTRPQNMTRAQLEAEIKRMREQRECGGAIDGETATPESLVASGMTEADAAKVMGQIARLRDVGAEVERCAVGGLPLALTWEEARELHSRLLTSSGPAVREAAVWAVERIDDRLYRFPIVPGEEAPDKALLWDIRRRLAAALAPAEQGRQTERGEP